MKRVNYEIIKKINCNLILLLSIITIFAFSVHIYQSNSKIQKIHIPQNLDEGIISFIKNNQIGNYEYPILKIKGKIPEEKLLSILNYFYLKIQININNILNKETTKTLEGYPYKRKWVEIDSNGNITIKEDDDNCFRLIYDPNHPDAIKENCPEKGYVRYPGVNLERELLELKLYEDLYNTFVSYGNKVYPSLLLEKINYQLDERLYSNHNREEIANVDFQSLLYDIKK